MLNDQYLSLHFIILQPCGGGNERKAHEWDEWIGFWPFSVAANVELHDDLRREAVRRSFFHIYS